MFKSKFFLCCFYRAFQAPGNATGVGVNKRWFPGLARTRFR